MQLYPGASRTIVRTNHKDLYWLLTWVDAQGNLARWRKRLVKFDFEVFNIAGSKHQVAVALLLSRTQETKKTSLDEELQVPIKDESKKQHDVKADCF